MKNRALIVAALLALSLPVAASSGDAEVGKKKSTPCAVCHGANGVSVIFVLLKVAGQF